MAELAGEAEPILGSGGREPAMEGAPQLGASCFLPLPSLSALTG